MQGTDSSEPRSVLDVGGTGNGIIKSKCFFIKISRESDPFDFVPCFPKGTTKNATLKHMKFIREYLSRRLEFANSSMNVGHRHFGEVFQIGAIRLPRLLLSIELDSLPIIEHVVYNVHPNLSSH